MAIAIRWFCDLDKLVAQNVSFKTAFTARFLLSGNRVKHCLTLNAHQRRCISPHENPMRSKAMHVSTAANGRRHGGSAAWSSGASPGGRVSCGLSGHSTFWRIGTRCSRRRAYSHYRNPSSRVDQSPPPTSTPVLGRLLFSPSSSTQALHTACEDR